MLKKLYSYFIQSELSILYYDISEVFISLTYDSTGVGAVYVISDLCSRFDATGLD